MVMSTSRGGWSWWIGRWMIEVLVVTLRGREFNKIGIGHERFGL